MTSGKLKRLRNAQATVPAVSRNYGAASAARPPTTGAARGARTGPPRATGRLTNQVAVGRPSGGALCEALSASVDVVTRDAMSLGVVVGGRRLTIAQPGGRASHSSVAAGSWASRRRAPPSTSLVVVTVHVGRGRLVKAVEHCQDLALGALQYRSAVGSSASQTPRGAQGVPGPGEGLDDTAARAPHAGQSAVGALEAQQWRAPAARLRRVLGPSSWADHPPLGLVADERRDDLGTTRHDEKTRRLVRPECRRPRRGRRARSREATAASTGGATLRASMTSPMSDAQPSVAGVDLAYRDVVPASRRPRAVGQVRAATAPRSRAVLEAELSAS